MNNLLRTHDPRAYAVILVRWAGTSELSLLADARNRVVIFDNAQVAHDFIPLVGDGRICSFDHTGEVAHFLPLHPDGINQATIGTEYDVYDTPNGGPAMSEARGMAWKHHVIWSEYLEELRNSRNSQLLNADIQREEAAALWAGS